MGLQTIGHDWAINTHTHMCNILGINDIELTAVIIFLCCSFSKGCSLGRHYSGLLLLSRNCILHNSRGRHSHRLQAVKSSSSELHAGFPLRIKNAQRSKIFWVGFPQRQGCELWFTWTMTPWWTSRAVKTWDQGREGVNTDPLQSRSLLRKLNPVGKAVERVLNLPRRSISWKRSVHPSHTQGVYRTSLAACTGMVSARSVLMGHW